MSMTEWDVDFIRQFFLIITCDDIAHRIVGRPRPFSGPNTRDTGETRNVYVKDYQTVVFSFFVPHRYYSQNCFFLFSSVAKALTIGPPISLCPSLQIRTFRHFCLGRRKKFGINRFLQTQFPPSNKRLATSTTIFSTRN